MRHRSAGDGDLGPPTWAPEGWDPAEVTEAVTHWCGGGDALALETQHDDVQVVEAHVADSMHVHLNRP